MREEVIKATFLFVTNVLIHVRIVRQTIVVRVSALNRSIREIFIFFRICLDHFLQRGHHEKFEEQQGDGRRLVD